MDLVLVVNDLERILRNTSNASFQTPFQNLEMTGLAVQEPVGTLAAALDSNHQSLPSRPAHG